MYYVMRISGLLALCLLAFAAWAQVRLARADMEFRSQRADSASELSPSNTEYLALRALQIEYEGGDASRLLEHWADLNPSSSAPRIRLGLAAELRGDDAAAEKWLLAAARADHQYEPRWTLANFYFRHDRADDFWKWIHSALEISYGDRAPAFDLCWRASSDPRTVLTRAIPNREEVAAAYLVYLIRKNATPALFDAAMKLASWRDTNDRELLYSALDTLLSIRASGTIELWQAIGNPAPSGITNGDFAAPPLNHGFDWRLLDPPGVTHVSPSAGHRIVLNGQSPESCDLLRQTLVLQRGQGYRLTWQSRTEGLGSQTGVSWRIAGSASPIATGEQERSGELQFTADSDFEDLFLSYQRPRGQTRAEGSVELRAIRLVRL